MEEVILFDKSLQERLQEYHDVLCGNEVLCVSNIQKEWSFFFELTIDPNGWQAIWKIPRNTCEQLKIPFPSIVLVIVLRIELKTLQALVRVLAVQDDDIHIPEKHYVPLIQLWVTKEQDKSVALNLHSTANAIDMLRFFYTKLFMPWDLDEDDSYNWRDKHLESRLRLYYDMKNGIIPRATGEHIHSLLTEAKRLQAKREEIESEVSDVEDIDEELPNNKSLESLMQIHVRILEIKSEMEILEDPLLRKVVIKRQNELLQNINDPEKSHIWLVFEEGLVDNYIKFLNEVKSLYPHQPVSFTSSLANILEVCNSNDVFILNESSHNIRTTGALENGGILRGISNKENTIVTSEIDDVMLDFRNNEVVIENLTILARKAKCAMLVRRGKVTLNNVKIIGDGVSSTHQGIIVLTGAQLELNNCEILEFSSAVVGNSESKITIRNSEIHKVNCGIQIYDNCYVNAANTVVRDCRDYGIVVESENRYEGRSGTFETLNIIPYVKAEHLSGNNNSKGDVVINQKTKIKPVEDLFGNPDLDPTIIEDDDEEMSHDVDYTGSTTVIENTRKDNMSPVTV